MTLRVAEMTAAPRLLFPQGRQQSLWIGVVAEGAAHVDEDVAIFRAEKEAGAELEGILPQPMLPVARRPLQVVRLPAASPSRVRQAA